MLFSLAAGVAHEAGHISVCAAGGHDYVVGLGPFGAAVDCLQPPDPLRLYMAMGGAAGAASLAPLVAWGRLRRSAPWWAGLLAAVYIQLATMVIETTANQMYMTSPFPTLTAVVPSVAIVLLVLRSCYKSRQRVVGGPE